MILGLGLFFRPEQRPDRVWMRLQAAMSIMIKRSFGVRGLDLVCWTDPIDLIGFDWIALI